MLNARGALVVVMVAVAAWLCGYRYSEQRWSGWTYAHVAFETKGDRK